MKLFKAMVSAAFLLLAVNPPAAAALSAEKENSYLLYHAYSAYDAADSRLYCYDFKDNTQKEISPDSLASGTFIHAMNGDFGSHPYDIVFMAIDPAADEWDIYRYNAYTNTCTNLTLNSGFRNEDPKFSPDGNKIAFKRGYWSFEHNGFIYNLAELDLRTDEITMLTDDVYENSMPYYSADGSIIYYARMDEGISSIYQLDMKTHEISEVFAEKNVTAYYPITSGNDLYFIKWYDASNHNDSLIRMSENGPVSLPFNNADYDCSDPFILSDGSIIYCSTKNGSYDLFYYDSEAPYELENLNTDIHELGPAFYSENDLKAIIESTADYLLGKSDSHFNMDADGDGKVDSFDLIALRQAMK